MNLGAIQTSITSWVEGLMLQASLAREGETVAAQIEWGRQPMQYHTEPFILAYAGPIVKLGHDEPIYVYNELTDELEEKMIGVRRLMLRLSFRSFDQRLGWSSRQYAEDFRLLTQSSSSIDTLHSAYLGLWDTGELVDTDYEWSGRLVSQTDMDVTLGVRAELPNLGYSGSYIKNVNIEGYSYLLTEQGNPIEDELGNPVVDEEALTISVTTE
jgi:hypothetical protein